MMARRKDPEYVTGARGSYEIAAPVVHPPRCVCKACARRRTDAEWDAPFTIRLRRKSPFPSDKRESSAYAYQLRREIEAQLVLDVEEAERRHSALGGIVKLETIAASYAEHMRREGKRLDRDRYRIEAIVEAFGPRTDPTTITKADYRTWCERLQTEGKTPATILRYTNTLLAILNGAKKDDLIADHQLTSIRKPRVRVVTKPKTFSRRQVAILLGPAIDEWEREQAKLGERKRDGTFGGASLVPLRGLCLVAYYTLMRPENNFALTWEQLWIDPVEDRGTFRLDKHKNASKGVNVEGALHPEIVRYLRPLQGRGLVHPNPETGDVARNIRTAWTRILVIADRMLGDGEKLKGAKFYTWRHTGASHLAEASGNPVLVARMMGDTSLRTVMNHYFDTSLEHMGGMVERWKAPRVEAKEEREETWTN